MTTTITTTGVTTSKQLNKECLKIDLNKVEYKVGYKVDGYGGYNPQKFHTDTQGENPYISIGKTANQLVELSRYFINPLLDLEINSLKRHSYAIYLFGGGKRGRRGHTHNDFTDAKIIVDKPTNQIVGVVYAVDNDFLNGWLRQTIDPSIPNNWDELHREKEFEVLITTTTYTTEKVKVAGRSYEDAMENLRKTDPMLDVTDYANHITDSLYSGRKTISTKEGDKPYPPSYDEWVSLNEKEIA